MAVAIRSASFVLKKKFSPLDAHNSSIWRKKKGFICKMSTSESPNLSHSITLPNKKSEPVRILAEPGVSSSDFCSRQLSRGGARAEQARELLGRCSNKRHLCQVQAFMLTTGLVEDDILLSRFIYASASLGFPSYAYSVFSNTHTHCPSIFVYNNIIWALSSSNPPLAFSIFNSIRRLSLRPDSYSFPFVLKAVLCLVDSPIALSLASQIHSQAVAAGLNSHHEVAASLVRVYSSCGRLSCIRKLFDEVPLSSRYTSLWNAILAAYAKVGDMTTAHDLFESMPEKDRNVVSWTTLVSGYLQKHNPNEAIALFRRMQIHRVQPDEIAILAVLSACADLGALELGEWIHNFIEKHKMHKTVPLCNALIDMYAKSGNISRALHVFENMKHKTVVTWTTMIAGFAFHGLGKEALHMFSCMENAQVKPNQVTFIAILSACSHVGFLGLSRRYFSSMRSKYGIEPKVEHYGCMIDLLGRAGYLQEAKDLVSQMPFEANAAIWGSLLAGATRYGNAGLAAEALHHLIKLEPHNSGNYSLLSNTYASLGRWSEARMVRKAMRDTGVEKMPGVSFIEVNNKVYEFIAGDKSGIYFVDICDVLHSINGQLKMAHSFFLNAIDSSLFKQWLHNLQSETGILADGTLALRQVLIQGVDMFGKRIGFLKFKADIYDKQMGKKVPGIVFARGPAVTVLILLESDGETYAVLTEQARVPTGRIILELPAGMLDDDKGDFVGTAVREVEEETGIKLKLEDMVDLTAFLDSSTGCRFFPSPGGCDEEISIFLYRGRVDKEIITQLHGKETGLRDHGELIKVRVVPYKKLWRTTADAKALAAVALLEMATKEGLLPPSPT
ncbi:hypothetical protein HN51_001479 [Arachis hypogaea]